MSFRIDERGLLRWIPWEERGWLAHGFSTLRAVEPAWEGEPGAGRRLELRQTHSAIVLEAAEIAPSNEEPPEGDALVGDAGGVLLTIRTADCLPALLVDPVRRAVGAAHAGWRGMAAGIVAEAAAEMTRRYGSRPEELEALLGPAISAESYEVGEEVAERFAAEAVQRRPEWPRPHLDLARAARLQLIEAGLAPERIADSNLCTFRNPELFPSYRRDGKKSGRLVAAIGVRS
ncbi:MAG: peptidoglycan editing factor PgeF [Acidobacteria bacterium]|nr:peptidoglycan editing factor PgeF [Acidobacteriota bacterium]